MLVCVYMCVNMHTYTYICKQMYATINNMQTKKNKGAALDMILKELTAAGYTTRHRIVKLKKIIPK